MLNGGGAKGVCLLTDSYGEQKHHMLARLLRRSGLTEGDIYLSTASSPTLLGDLQNHNVRVVMPLGDRALRTVLGEADIARWRGRVTTHPHLKELFVVPGLQPSKLMPRHGAAEDNPNDILARHPPRFHGIWIRDIHHAINVAREGFTRLAVNYLVDPDPGTFAQFADEYFAAWALDPENVWLSWDIETYYKQKNSNEEDLEEKELQIDGTILRISFCFRPGYSVSVPWSPSYEPTIRRLLLAKGVMVVWNGRTFDKPVVEAAGYPVGGVIYEGMDGYHLLQSDLPKGLEWVSSEATDLLPWKHLAGSQPGWYSATDPDAALRNMIWLKEQLTNAGQWPLFLNHVVRLMPILDMAGHRGNKVDRAKRDEIRSRLTAMRDEMVEQIQPTIPWEVYPRKEWKTPPFDHLPKFVDPMILDTTGTTLVEDGRRFDVVRLRDEVKVCSHCGHIATNSSEHFKGGKKGNPCKAAGAVIAKQPGTRFEYHELEPFNPNSSLQLKAFMTFQGHPIGVDKRDSSKETTDAGHLKKLAKDYPKFTGFYRTVLDIHKAGKTIGTYTPEPDAQDLIHTQYVNSPSTWRLGSRKVTHGTQIQNWGKREENKYAKEARGQIIARDGHKLVQIDSSAVEAVMQGYAMNDPDYMNIASKSIHAWLSCKALGLPFNPANVDIIKEKHETLYLKMKIVNYLTNFGGGAKLMTDTFPDEFPTRKSAEETQEMLYNLLPSLKAYHHAVRWEAHTKTFLTTAWGYRHWYYDVFKRKFDGTIVLSKDSKRSVALKPQNSNAAFQKDNLLLLAASRIDGDVITDISIVENNWDDIWNDIVAERTWARYMGTNVSIHDSGCLDAPEEMEKHLAENVMLPIYTRPIPQMHGLRIGAEVESGWNWAGFDEVKNPKGMKRIAKKVIEGYTWRETEAGIPPLAEAA